MSSYWSLQLCLVKCYQIECRSIQHNFLFSLLCPIEIHTVQIVGKGMMHACKSFLFILVLYLHQERQSRDCSRLWTFWPEESAQAWIDVLYFNRNILAQWNKSARQREILLIWVVVGQQIDQRVGWSISWVIWLLLSMPPSHTATETQMRAVHSFHSEWVNAVVVIERVGWITCALITVG